MEFTLICPNDGRVELDLEDISTIIFRGPESVEVVFVCPHCGSLVARRASRAEPSRRRDGAGSLRRGDGRRRDARDPSPDSRDRRYPTTARQPSSNSASAASARASPTASTSGVSWRPSSAWRTCSRRSSQPISARRGRLRPRLTRALIATGSASAARCEPPDVREPRHAARDAHRSRARRGRCPAAARTRTR